MFIAILIFLSLIKLINLNSIPPFGDETLYLSLADDFRSDPVTAFKSIGFGVFPVYIWTQTILQIATYNHFNPLLLGRASSVAFDLLSAWLIFQIGNKLATKSLGILSAVIYLSLPLIFFHGRFALLESLINLFSLTALYFVTIIFVNPKSRINYIQTTLASLFIALSFFTKPSAVISLPAIYLLPIYTILKTKDKIIISKLIINYIILVILSVSFMATFYFPTSREFTSRFISESNNTLSSSLLHLKTNFWRVWWWSNNYLGLTILVLLMPILFWGLWKRFWIAAWLWIWIISVVTVGSLVAANYFPRHLFPLGPPVALVIGFFICRLLIWKRLLAVSVLILLMIPWWIMNYQILFSPQSAPIALEDRQQFYEDWNSGTGLKEMAQKLSELSINKPITVIVENNPHQAWVFQRLYQVGQTEIVPSNNLNEGKYIEESIVQKLDPQKPIFIILNKNPAAPAQWPVSLVAAFSKGPYRTINLYQINP